MIARMLPSPCRPSVVVAGLALVSVTGCHGLGRSTRRRAFRNMASIDPNQPASCARSRRIRTSSNRRTSWKSRFMPPFPDWSTRHFTVQADGNVDLGFAGDVYVSGLTLAEAEERIAAPVERRWPRSQATKPSRPYRVSVRLANGQSKYYYVIGTVTTQGKVKVNANDTVLDAILQAGLKSNSLPEKAYLVRPHPLGRTGPGFQDRLVRHQGPGRHADELPGLPRRSGHRPGHQAARADQQPAGN